MGCSRRSARRRWPPLSRPVHLNVLNDSAFRVMAALYGRSVCCAIAAHKGCPLSWSQLLAFAGWWLAPKSVLENSVVVVAWELKLALQFGSAKSPLRRGFRLLGPVAAAWLATDGVLWRGRCASWFS